MAALQLFLRTTAISCKPRQLADVALLFGLIVHYRIG